MPAHDAHELLAAHDPAVGSLRLLLGTGLAERLGAPVTRGYLRYKPGTSATALLDVDGRSAIGYAWGPAREEKRHKAVRRVTAEDVLLDDPAAGLLVVDARTDRHLKALRTRVRAWPGGTYTLSHKPARRWVGRSGPRVLRVYARSGYARALAGHAAVLADGGGGLGFRLPQVLERDDAGLIVLRHLPGSTLGAPVGEPALRRLGACLGAFHTKGWTARLRASSRRRAPIARCVRWSPSCRVPPTPLPTSSRPRAAPFARGRWGSSTETSRSTRWWPTVTTSGSSTSTGPAEATRSTTSRACSPCSSSTACRTDSARRRHRVW